MKTNNSQSQLNLRFSLKLMCQQRVDRRRNLGCNEIHYGGRTNLPKQLDLESPVGTKIGEDSFYSTEYWDIGVSTL